MNPDILVLDEPTAGLDPKGAIDTLDLFKKLNKDGKTIVLVTHEMDYVLQYCDKVIVLKDGVIEAFDSPINIFMNKRLLERVGIEEPLVIKIMQELINSGMKLDYWKIKDVSSLVDQIVKSRGYCK
ncbi:Energy-coupling factor transporter ATP-binding protein EcfA2 [bioreactor metagenome]|uniref:Energy-coupling factor transporter ATP-binding protein EcfA2 n=1 Tax=bioreactor metagenome TaxID=1076179 RepID=A0A645IY48_9ZZZZ